MYKYMEEVVFVFNSGRYGSVFHENRHVFVMCTTNVDHIVLKVCMYIYVCVGGLSLVTTP